MELNLVAFKSVTK